MHLNLRDSRPQAAVPVHQAIVSVDEPIPVQADEGLLDSSTPWGIHREDQALPVDTAANAPKLIADAVALAVLPLEHLLQKLLSTCRQVACWGLQRLNSASESVDCLCVYAWLRPCLARALRG